MWFSLRREKGFSSFVRSLVQYSLHSPSHHTIPINIVNYRAKGRYKEIEQLNRLN
jgi:hypothetical protein